MENDLTLQIFSAQKNIFLSNAEQDSDPWLQDYVSAANCYEQLTLLHPDEEEYKVYYAQSLYSATLYEEAMKVTVTVEAPEYQGSMQKLQAAIK